jgi:hypothetical protein
LRCRAYFGTASKRQAARRRRDLQQLRAVEFARIVATISSSVEHADAASTRSGTPFPPGPRERCGPAAKPLLVGVLT